MSTLPLRFRLFYDPLFLSLRRRIDSGVLGTVAGVGVSAVVKSLEDLRDIAAFLVLLFKVPGDLRVSADRAASLARFLFLYDSFALSLDGCVAPLAVPAPAGVSLSGSVKCSYSLIEFRYGSERVCAAAPSEDERYRLAVPEGDGAYYRALDEASPDGARLLSSERDAEALAFVDRAIGSLLDSFPGRAP